MSVVAIWTEKLQICHTICATSAALTLVVNVQDGIVIHATSLTSAASFKSHFFF
jgi:hypothetical protein